MVESDKHILVVEDDPLTRQAMELLLGSAGYSVGCAANGREALDRLGWGRRPWLILLDLQMPLMDGWEFRRRQRQKQSLASIPVILLSAETGLPQHATSLGAAGYFPKPVEFDGLLQALRAMVQDTWTLPNVEDEVQACWHQRSLRSHAEAACVIEEVTTAMAAADYPEQDLFAIHVALKEAIGNAITHGHQGDPGKEVWVRFHVARDFMLAEVEDQGPGFDPQAVPDPVAPENLERPGGRGLLLMRAYTTQCRFNEKGNRVVLRKDRSAE